MSINFTRFTRWLLFIGVVLALPWIAMQFTNEVNWNLTDFAVAGSVLLTLGLGYEWIVRRSEHTIYHMAVGVGALGALLLFWVNGAVGIIGNEAQDANLLFSAVFVVGAVGMLLSKLQAAGMSRAMYATAIVTMLVPIAALLIWSPAVISWSPSVVGVFLMSGFFALLFSVSGMLFHQATKNS